jgi:hypothetical protein
VGFSLPLAISDWPMLARSFPAPRRVLARRWPEHAVDHNRFVGKNPKITVLGASHAK